jgi:hypothetical protein
MRSLGEPRLTVVALVFVAASPLKGGRDFFKFFRKWLRHIPNANQ